jgi:hypothetical protein
MKLNAVVIVTSILARAIGEHSKCDDLKWQQETCSASIGVQRYHAHLSSGNSCPRTVDNRRGDSTISTSTHASLGSTSTHFTLTSVLLPVPFSLIYWQVTLLFRHFVPCCHSRVPRMSRVYGVEELSATLYLGRFMTLVIAVWLRVNRQFSWQTSTTKESSKPVQ